MGNNTINRNKTPSENESQDFFFSCCNKVTLK